MFASPLMLFAGRVSYSLYMSHALSQRLLQIWLPPQNYTDANIAVKLAVVLADIVVIVGLATALYYLVEVPARNFMRRRVRR